MSTKIRRSSRGRRWRRFKRSLRQHPRRTAVAVGLGAIFLAVSWCVWTAWSVGQDLADAEREAGIMRGALVRGDAEGAHRALERFQDATTAAEGRTHGLTWSAFGVLPLLGDDARGMATVSTVLADLGRDGLPPVVDAADEVTANAFQPTDGRFPLTRIVALTEPARTSEAAFARATDDLAEVRSEGFIGPFASRFDELATLVEDARGTLESTYRAAQLMPVLLGQDGPRDYLLVLQNNAELRSGGGLPGAVSVVRADKGAVEIIEQTDMANLSVGREPVVELTSQERQVFGNSLAWAAVNATLTPDVERSSAIIRAHWNRKFGSRLDGIFYVDPVAVSYLLRGAGTVDVPGHPPITAGNVVQSVESDVYRASSDRNAHSDYQQAVAEAVFDAFASGVGDTAESIRGLVAGVTEGRIRMHSFRPAEQDVIAGTTIAGELPEGGSAEPEVGVYLNDAGPTKMQYYLRYDAELFARNCSPTSQQTLAGSIRFHSNTPADVATLPPAVTGEGYPGQRVAPGEQVLVVYLTAPVGGSIVEVVVDGQATMPDTVEFADRQLARLSVSLAPQERHEVSFVMKTGEGQPGDVDLWVTPGAHPGSPNGPVRSACALR